MRRGVRVLPAFALIALATAGCGPDGSDASGTLIPNVVGDEPAVRPGDAVLLLANEFSFAPVELVVEEGVYSGELVNEGKIAHNITFEGGDSFDVAAGETVRIEFEAPEGGVEFFCNIPGHAEAGMTGEVRTD